jgi:exopolysaccharide production protein ExoZ
VSSRLHNLQALRGVACLLVLVYHLAAFEPHTGASADRHLLHPLAYFGFAGVDLFFVLSGFVITWVHADVLGQPARLLGYLGRRLWRIYPVYWLCWWGAAALHVLYHGEPWTFGSWRLARTLLLIPSLRENEFLPPAWTLTLEVMFYCTFAVFFLLPRRAFPPLLALWFGALVPAAVIGRHAMSVSLGKLGLLPIWFFNPYVGEFLLGCFAAVAVRRGWVGWSRTCIAGGLVGFVAASLAIYTGAVIFDDTPRRVAVFALPAGLIVYGLVAAERARGWVLPRWLQVVGDASYPIYLVHRPMFLLAFWMTFGRFSFTGPGHLFWVYLLVIPALAAGFLVHFAVERPSLRLVRRHRPDKPLRLPPATVTADLRSAA